MLILSVDLFAKERRGANIEIYKSRPKMEGTPWEKPDIRGELIAVKENLFLIKEADSGVDVTIEDQ